MKKHHVGTRFNEEEIEQLKIHLEKLERRKLRLEGKQLQLSCQKENIQSEMYTVINAIALAEEWLRKHPSIEATLTDANGTRPDNTKANVHARSVIEVLPHHTMDTSPSGSMENFRHERNSDEEKYFYDAEKKL